ncbi:MAG: ATP-binding protein [Gemmatimonadaceae bacterium]
MNVTRSDVVPLVTEQDVVTARQFVRKLSQECGFSLIDQTKFVTAASELGRNAVKYGGGGEMRWQLMQDGFKHGVRLSFVDQGPGIANLEQALTDGFTTGGGLGMGLSGAKRLVNDFSLESEVGQGTTVTITRWK